MKKTGVAFEHDVKRIYEIIAGLDGNSIVSHDELITGPDGQRQFDVVLRTIIADEEYLTVIECKDYSRNVDVTAVDALHSKMADIRANKGILISRKGFSRSAKQKARRLGIALARVDSLANDLENPWSSLPVIFRHVVPESISLGIMMEDVIDSLKSLRVSPNNIVSGLSIAQLFRLIDFTPLLKNQKVEVELTERLLGKPVWLTNGEGEKCAMRKVLFRAKLSSEVHFGYASMLPSAITKSTPDGTRSDVFIDVEDFKNISDSFAKYSSFDEIPKHLVSNHLAAISVPNEFSYEGVTMMAKRQDDGKWEKII